jgi:hypothetical protein
MTTLSEVFQKKLNKKDCPYLHDCEVHTTRDFFKRICNTVAYVNCHHFAKKVGELKTPMAWLQKIAIDQDKIMEPQVETQ